MLTTVWSVSVYSMPTRFFLFFFTKKKLNGRLVGSWDACVHRVAYIYVIYIYILYEGYNSVNALILSSFFERVGCIFDSVKSLSLERFVHDQPVVFLHGMF